MYAFQPGYMTCGEPHSEGRKSTSRKHVNYVVEGHWVIVSTFEISWGTWITMEITLQTSFWAICHWPQRIFVILRGVCHATKRYVKTCKLTMPTPNTEIANFDTKWRCNHPKRVRETKTRKGGNETEARRHNRVKELEASWVSRRQNAFP